MHACTAAAAGRGGTCGAGGDGGRRQSRGRREARTSSYFGTGKLSSRVDVPIDCCSADSGVLRAVLLRLIFFYMKRGPR